LAKAAIVELTRQRDELSAKVNQLHRGSDSSESTTPTTGTIHSIGRSPAADDSVATTPPTPAEEQKRFFVASSGTPSEIRRKERELNKKNRGPAYIPLYRLLGFSAQEQEQFLSLKLDSIERTNDLFKLAARNAAHDRGNLQTTAEVVAEQGAAEWRSTLEQVYGDKIAEAIVNYETTLPIRAVADQFQANLSKTGTPMTEAQVENLIAILASTALTDKGKVSYLAIKPDIAVAKAQSLLSPDQLALLKTTLTRIH
jgi:hypothetical protein